MFGWPDDTLLCGFICRDQLSMPGSRAMVSHDEGNTWEDEVYYLDHSPGVGSYNASVVREDDLILTIDGTTDRGLGWMPPLAIPT